MPVTKIDPKIIFASDAPSQDQPSVFSNKPTGWGVSRQNGGRPTIKQANGVQQDTDLKILWLNENAVLPYDESLDYPVNTVTIKDGVFKIFNGTVWNLFLDKTSVGLGNVDNTSDSSKPISTATQSALNLKANQTSVDTELAKKADKLVTYTKVDVDGLLGLKADLNIVKRGIGNIYSSTLTYNINERVILTNGDVVKSIVDGNTNNPNTNMVGWNLDSLTPSKNLSDLPNISVARDNLGVYSEAEVDAIFAGATTVPNATETTAGKAKIATTAIARSGVNDTDFLTAKKLRDALNASGNAPIAACRAWVVFTCVSNVVTILNSMNILSVTRLGTSNFKITYATPMPTANNVPLASGQAAIGANNQYAMPPAIRNILAGSCEVYHNTPSADFPLVTLGVFC